jgi:hypothetical protein
MSESAKRRGRRGPRSEKQKEAAKVRFQNRKLAYPEKVKSAQQKYHHKYEHGELYEEKLKRIELQGGRCANPGCRTTDPGAKGWHTDHDHVSGKIRGELCGACNIALGLLKDDEFKAEGLASYLRQHK